jgi:hypothetical protein
VLKKDASKLEPVMKLPCMQQLSSTQLCSSIYRAGKVGCKMLAQQLCRWVRVLFLRYQGGRTPHRLALHNSIKSPRLLGAGG